MSEKQSYLYAFWALKHLMAIDKAIYDLSQYSNLNLNEAILGLERARKKLLKTWAYQEAERQLDEMACKGLIRKMGYIYLGTLGKEEAEL